MGTTYETLQAIASQAAHIDFLQKTIAGFAAVGWVQRADTGQIDPLAVGATAPLSASRHVLFFESSDALSTTAKAILKFEIYYSTTTWTSTTYLVLTLGLATDGAGTFVGPTSNLISGSIGAGWATLYAMAFSGNGEGGFSWEVQNGATESFLLVVDRSRDAAGAPTGDYMAAFFAYSSNGGGFGGIRFPSSVLPTLTNASNFYWPHALPTASGSLVYDGVTPVSPVFPLVGRLGNPITMAVACRTPDVSVGSTFDLNLYGQTRTFRRRLTTTTNGVGVNCAVACLWEPTP